MTACLSGVSAGCRPRRRCTEQHSRTATPPGLPGRQVTTPPSIRNIWGLTTACWPDRNRRCARPTSSAHCGAPTLIPAAPHGSLASSAHLPPPACLPASMIRTCPLPLSCACGSEGHVRAYAPPHHHPAACGTLPATPTCACTHICLLPPWCIHRWCIHLMAWDVALLGAPGAHPPPSCSVLPSPTNGRAATAQHGIIDIPPQQGQPLNRCTDEPNHQRPPAWHCQCVSLSPQAPRGPPK